MSDTLIYDLPAHLEKPLNNLLSALSVKHCEGEDDMHYAYGTNHECELFSLHRECYCQRITDCPYCADTCPSDTHECDPKCAYHQWGEEGKPNFIYHPTDFRLWWYKYIGRSTIVNNLPTLTEIRAMAANVL